MDNQIKGISSRVATNVGSSGNSGNNAYNHIVLTPQRQAEEGLATHATDLLPWLIENHALGTVSVRDVHEDGPADIRRLTAADVGEILEYLEAQGLVTPAGAVSGSDVPLSGKRWLIQANDAVCRNLHLSDLAHDALVMTSDLVGIGGEQVGRVLALALLHWMNAEPVRMHDATQLADAAIAAVAATGAGAA